MEQDAGIQKEAVVVEVHFDTLEQKYGYELYKFGRRLAYRWKRDAEVILGPGVSVGEGGFPDSGGSKQYPRLDPLPGTILQVRDVPFAAAKAAISEDPSGYSLLNDTEEKILLLEDEKIRLEKNLKKITKELDFLYNTKNNSF